LQAALAPPATDAEWGRGCLYFRFGQSGALVRETENHPHAVCPTTDNCPVALLYLAELLKLLQQKVNSAFWHAEMFNQLRGIAPQMLVARIGFSYTWTNCIAVENPQNRYGQKRKTYLAWRRILLGPKPWSKK
jgi:hypothetical protein